MCRGSWCRGVAEAGLHFTLEKFSLLGNQRLGMDHGEVECGDVHSQQENICCCFSRRLSKWGRKWCSGSQPAQAGEARQIRRTAGYFSAAWTIIIQQLSCYKMLWILRSLQQPSVSGSLRHHLTEEGAARPWSQAPLSGAAAAPRGRASPPSCPTAASVVMVTWKVPPPRGD